jgi:hypothetical protein
MHLYGRSVVLAHDLVNVSPNVLLEAEVRDPCAPPETKKRRANDSAEKVTDDTKAWDNACEVAGLR